MMLAPYRSDPFAIGGAVVGRAVIRMQQQRFRIGDRLASGWPHLLDFARMLWIVAPESIHTDGTIAAVIQHILRRPAEDFVLAGFHIQQTDQPFDSRIEGRLLGWHIMDNEAPVFQ